MWQSLATMYSAPTVGPAGYCSDRTRRSQPARPGRPQGASIPSEKDAQRSCCRDTSVMVDVVPTGSWAESVDTRVGFWFSPKYGSQTAVEWAARSDKMVLQRRYGGFANWPAASRKPRHGRDSNPQTPACKACALFPGSVRHVEQRGLAMRFRQIADRPNDPRATGIPGSTAPRKTPPRAPHGTDRQGRRTDPCLAAARRIKPPTCRATPHRGLKPETKSVTPCL